MSISYVHFSKHVADESSFEFRRPPTGFTPVGSRFENYERSHFTASSPSGFMPVERRFDNYNHEPLISRSELSNPQSAGTRPVGL